jgi:predicted dehydrogenase
MTPPLRVGIVGYGYATQVFHAPLVSGVPGLLLTAISSRDPARVAADWPQVEPLPTPEALFARSDIDLVVVPTPNDTHHPIARAALLAGKHVVVDKPFTLDLAQARDLIELAAQQQRVLSVFHNRRWDSDFLALREVLAGGALGRVVEVQANFDRYRPVVKDRWREAGGPGSGLWFDLGPHLIDQALQLFGWPDGIHLDLARLRDGASADDCFDATLRYGHALRVRLHASTLAAQPAPRWAVHGTRGSFVKHGLDTQEDAMKAGARPQLATLGGWGADPRPAALTLQDEPAGPARTVQAPNPPGNYLAFYAAVRDTVLGLRSNPVTGQEAARVMALIEAGLASAAEHREISPQQP